MLFDVVILMFVGADIDVAVVGIEVVYDAVVDLVLDDVVAIVAVLAVVVVLVVVVVEVDTGFANFYAIVILFVADDAVGGGFELVIAAAVDLALIALVVVATVAAAVAVFLVASVVVVISVVDILCSCSFGCF